VVSVFLSGRPLFTNREINASDAFVAAWLPGTQGDGVADVIVAQKSGKPKMDFTGRLPFAWPNDARAPVTAPLFDLGYGLTYASSVELAALSEDPGMDLTKAMNVDQYFAAGRAQDPWTLSISDTGGKRPVVGPSTTTPDAQLSVRSVDVGAQEDGKAFVWKGSGSITIEGPPADISQFDRNRYGLAVTWRIDAKPVGKTILFFGDTPISIDTMLANVAIGSITSSAFPLHCFAMAAGSTANLGSAFRLDGHAGFAMTLQSVKLVEMPNGTQCPN
jgi:beta-glucosidase